jgi:hypothetical protein
MALQIRIPALEDTIGPGKQHLFNSSVSSETAASSDRVDLDPAIHKT